MKYSNLPLIFLKHAHLGGLNYRTKVWPAMLDIETAGSRFGRQKKKSLEAWGRRPWLDGLSATVIGQHTRSSSEWDTRPTIR